MAKNSDQLIQPSTAVPVEQHQVAGVSLLLQIVMVGAAFVLGHVLRRHKFYYLHEASASLLIGMIVGAISNISNTEESFKRWFNFNEEFFFLFLLPPIIFQSGFSLRPKPFFTNFGAICTFAILGTFIASMVTGILVFLGGLFFLMYRLPFLECLLFGSLISSTDPITVLAIFQELGTDTNLYALVFGESVLNDAVAISLYRTLKIVRRYPHMSYSLFPAIWSFLETFAGSMTMGVVVALGSALLFKYAGLAVNNRITWTKLDFCSLQNLECCLVVLFPYFSYMLAEGLGLSGIVAILFCGIVMKRYTLSNLSKNAQAFTASFFQLVASLAETFIFIYMGLDIATEKHSWSHVGFIFFSIVIIVVARGANVFACARLINLVRPASTQIPLNHQKALWFSGLRGAMAFALALQSMHDLPDKGHGRAIFTTTTAIVVITVLIIGGSTSTMLSKLGVTGSDYVAMSAENAEVMENFTIADDDDFSNGYDEVKSRLQESPRSSSSFVDFDNKFIRPLLTTRTGDSNDTIKGLKHADEAGRGISFVPIQKHSQTPDGP